MLYQIKKVKILSIARIMAIFYGATCLIPTAVMLATGIFDGFGGYWTLGQMIFPVFFPIFGAIAGFVGGLISGLIYNWIAEYWGGIEMEIEAMEKIEMAEENIKR